MTQQKHCAQCSKRLPNPNSLEGKKRHLSCVFCGLPFVTIAGKYTLQKQLGEGGVGRVFLAEHNRLKLDKLRAIKFLKKEYFESETAIERFQREIQLTVSISQRNEHVVRVYDDFGQIPELGYYYVMEYLEGSTLGEYLEEEPEPPIDVCIHIFKQLCFAMDAAHNAGVIHRDLKPDNIFLTRRGKEQHFVKVMDFGIAQPLSNVEHRLTPSSSMLGTPLYMSPEQLKAQRLDDRSDIYSMGLILYEMLTGQPPFVPDLKAGQMALLSLAEAQMYHEPIPPRELKPERNIPKELEDFTLKALDKDPYDRFQCVEEMLERLEIVEAKILMADFTESSEQIHDVIPLSSGLSLVTSKRLTPPPPSRVVDIFHESKKEAREPTKQVSPLEKQEIAPKEPEKHQAEIRESFFDDAKPDTGVDSGMFAEPEVRAKPEAGAEPDFESKPIVLPSKKGEIPTLFYIIPVLFFVMIIAVAGLYQGSAFVQNQKVPQSGKQNKASKKREKVTPAPKDREVLHPPKREEQPKKDMLNIPVRKTSARPKSQRALRRRRVLKNRRRTPISKRRRRRRRRKRRRSRRIPPKRKVSRRKAPSGSVAGCPTNASGGRWIRLELRPTNSRITVNTTFLKYNTYVCIQQKRPSQRFRASLVAPGYQPCSFSRRLRKNRYTLRLKRDLLLQPNSLVRKEMLKERLDDRLDYCAP